MRELEQNDAGRQTARARGARYASLIAHHASLLAVCLTVSAAEPDLTKLPPAAGGQIDFARDIKPIFERSCFKCHGPEKPKGRFSLVSREAALRGGNENTDDLVPGNSAKSRMIHYVARLVPDFEMPPEGKGEPLTAGQIGMLRAWIDQGAIWEKTEPMPQVQFSVSPTLKGITVNGDAAKFRELNWMRDGWNGGAEQFELQDRLGNDSRITVEGHALLDDYRTTLTLEKTDFGFARFGWEQYRKYYDDSGGYHPDLTPPEFSLDHDLHLDWGRAWGDFGLTLPDWPRMVLGYEYQYRDGEKSTLQWGAFGEGLEARKILPASKTIEEHTHVLKFDLEHEIGGVRFEDRFRGEFGELKTQRTNLWSLPGSPPHRDVAKDDYRHFEGVNSFLVTGQFKDRMFGSVGYLYSKLDADAAFDLTPVLPLPGGFDAYRWSTRAIVLEQESHVLNLSGRMGPFDGLTITAGVLGEWSRQDGIGTAIFDSVDSPAPDFNDPDFLVTFDRNFERSLVEEKVAARYTKIPFTVLFAEAGLQQESIGENQEQLGGDFYGSQGFLRRSDITSDLQDYRAGFSASPWRRISFSSHYRRYEKDTAYDHPVDLAQSGPFQFEGEGYPAFIRSLNRRTEEVEAKLALRPASWLRTSLNYKIIATDYRTTTDLAPKSSGDFSTGGGTLARNYDAGIWGVNMTLTPWQRLYLSTTFSYQQSRTLSAQNGSTAVSPFRGDIYSLLTSANYALNPKTDLRATYSFSAADYGQDNFDDGLPLGITYRQHSIRAGLTRRVNKRLTTTLQYGLYRYNEPGGGRFNNYTAHAIFGTISYAWP